PASRPSLARPWTQQPTSSSSGWPTMPWMAARPTPPGAHWVTRYLMALALGPGGPLLAARGEPFDEVFGDEPDGRVHRLEPQRLVETAVAAGVDGRCRGLAGGG